MPCARKLLEPPDTGAQILTISGNNDSNGLTNTNFENQIQPNQTDDQIEHVSNKLMDATSNLQHTQNEFVTLALSESYKYRSTQNGIKVPEYILSVVKKGNHPSQKISAHYCPIAVDSTASLLDYNDKCSRHPFARIRKSDLSGIVSKQIISYHDDYGKPLPVLQVMYAYQLIFVVSLVVTSNVLILSQTTLDCKFKKAQLSNPSIYI